VFYAKYYKSVICGKGFGSKSIRKTHQSMERRYSGNFYSQTLELGGGVGEHLDFVLHGYDKYYLTDIQLPVLEATWQENPRVICQVQNAENLTFDNGSFDRVIATCLLHHVEKPEKVLTEILRVLKPNGVATIFLPCDPGLAVRILRALTTARSANKHGFQGYYLMISREHRNHIGSLLNIVRYVFRHRQIKATFRPLGIPSWNLNGFVVVHIS
jgi:ubiquinone/menaquinone biosynthesis C-methylase UbiE